MSTPPHERSGRELLENFGVRQGQRAALWDAIHRYVRSCGGNPAEHVHGNTERMDAVVAVEEAARRFL